MLFRSGHSGKQTQRARAAGGDAPRVHLGEYAFELTADAVDGAVCESRAVVVDQRAAEMGFEAIELNVRDTQKAAIALYESHGYVRWATKQRYAKANGQFIVGHYYQKEITPLAPREGAAAANVSPLARL